MVERKELRVWGFFVLRLSHTSGANGRLVIS